MEISTNKRAAVLGAQGSRDRPGRPATNWQNEQVELISALKLALMSRGVNSHGGYDRRTGK